MTETKADEKQGSKEVSMYKVKISEAEAKDIGEKRWKERYESLHFWPALGGLFLSGGGGVVAVATGAPFWASLLVFFGVSQRILLPVHTDVGYAHQGREGVRTVVGREGN